MTREELSSLLQVLCARCGARRSPMQETCTACQGARPFAGPVDCPPPTANNGAIAMIAAAGAAGGACGWLVFSPAWLVAIPFVLWAMALVAQRFTRLRVLEAELVEPGSRAVARVTAARVGVSIRGRRLVEGEVLDTPAHLRAPLAAFTLARAAAVGRRLALGQPNPSIGERPREGDLVFAALLFAGLAARGEVGLRRWHIERWGGPVDGPYQVQQGAAFVTVSATPSLALNGELVHDEIVGLLRTLASPPVDAPRFNAREASLAPPSTSIAMLQWVCGPSDRERTTWNRDVYGASPKLTAPEEESAWAGYQALLREPAWRSHLAALAAGPEDATDVRPVRISGNSPMAG